MSKLERKIGDFMSEHFGLILCILLGLFIASAIIQGAKIEDPPCRCRCCCEEKE